MSMRHFGGRALLGIGLVFIISLSLTACSSDSNGGGGGDLAAASGGDARLTLVARDFAFDPTTINASAGSVQITLTNTGNTKHSFTLDDGSVSEDIEKGETETVTLDLTKTVGFHCKYHPNLMKGTLQVA
jgi:plastocyanin